jgi:hypothetical protein
MTGAEIPADLWRLGFAAVETQVRALNRALNKRVKLADRRLVHRLCNQLVGRLVAWRELLTDEPEFLARLEALAERTRGAGQQHSHMTRPMMPVLLDPPAASLYVCTVSTWVLGKTISLTSSPRSVTVGP